MEEAKEKPIRVRMRSRRLHMLEKVTDDFVAVAKGKNLTVLGPAWILPKVVNIRNRLAPSPDGTNLIRNFELLIHENLVEVFSSTEVIEQIISGCKQWDVEIQIIVIGEWRPEPRQVGVSFGLSQPSQDSGPLPLSLSMEEAKGKQLKQIRLRMTSRKLHILDKVTADFVAVAKSMNLTVLGPGRIPTKVVNIRKRLAPSPDGTNLIRNFALRIHENLVKVFSYTEVVEQIISSCKQWGVEIEIMVVGEWRPEPRQVGASFGLSQPSQD